MAEHLNWENNTVWPDFYALLEADFNADSELLRRAISAAYAKASALCDHRDLNTRFANQTLIERVLPQCRRILLDSTLRRAYDQQWQLHREGNEMAQSYQAFLAEVKHRTDVDWPNKGSNAEETDFLPNVRSQEFEMVPEGTTKPGAASRATNIIVPLVVPATRVSVEKGDKMKDRHTEIKGGITFDQLQTRPKRQAKAGGRGVVVGALLSVAAIAGLGAAWAGGLLSGTDKNRSTPPSQTTPQIVHRPAAPAAASSSSTNAETQIENAPPVQAGKPGTPPGKAQMPLSSLAANSDFEGGKLGAWKASNTHAYSEMPPGMPDPRSGDYVMTMWSPQPYAVTVEQTVRDLKPGFYTFTAWIRRSGGQSVATMAVSDHGDKRREIPIPATLSWTPISIRNIKVTSGQCKLEFSTAGGALKWIQVDAVEFSPN